MSRTWVLDRCFLAFHCWDASFHPKLNAPVNHIVWVKLYGLPIHFWSYQVLKAIGDCVGRCHFADPKCHDAFDKKVAWVLIEFPFAGGLPAEIHLQWDGRVYQQTLDYWKVPFRCHLCHETGNLMQKCSKWREDYMLKHGQQVSSTIQADSVVAKQTLEDREAAEAVLTGKNNPSEPSLTTLRENDNLSVIKPINLSEDPPCVNQLLSASISGTSVVTMSEIFPGLGLKKSSSLYVGPLDSSLFSGTSPWPFQDHIPSWYFAKVPPFPRQGMFLSPLIIPWLSLLLIRTWDLCIL